jgi:hypothetical protein
MKIEIKTEKGFTARTINADAKKGLNYFDYDIALDSSLVSDYQKSWNDNRGKDEDELKLEKKDSGRYYLAPGKYEVVITDARGTTVKKEFSIVKPKGRHKPRGTETETQHD